MVEKDDLWDKEPIKAESTEPEEEKPKRKSSRKKKEKAYVGAMNTTILYPNGFRLVIRVGEKIENVSADEIGRLLRYGRIKEG